MLRVSRSRILTSTDLKKCLKLRDHGICKVMKGGWVVPLTYFYWILWYDLNSSFLLKSFINTDQYVILYYFINMIVLIKQKSILSSKSLLHFPQRKMQASNKIFWQENSNKSKATFHRQQYLWNIFLTEKSIYYLQERLSSRIFSSQGNNYYTDRNISVSVPLKGPSLLTWNRKNLNEACPFDCWRYCIFT